MKTITTDEERMQLHKNGYFLEGYFNSLRSMNVGKMALLFSVFVFTFVLLFVYYLELWKMLTVVALISVAGCVVFEPLLNIMDLRWFQKRKVKQLLKEQQVEINWATIVQIDKENRRISFLEDDAKSPEGKPYIVDYIATGRDCRWVVKGERIILVHIRDKGGKEILLPMIPKREFSLLREREKCGPVRVAGIVHVPHPNAFLRKENEVLFHSRFSVNNWTIDLKKYGRGRCGERMPNAILVDEWNGEAYERNLYMVGLFGNWSYGDILQKKEKRFIIGNPEYYFVKK